MKPSPFVVALVTFGALGATFACGSRTGLSPDESGGASLSDAGDAPNDASDDVDASVSAGGYPFCDPRLGPLSASEVAEGSFTPRCNSDFPRCVAVGGQWGCCHGPGPYIGPTGSCIL